MSFLCGSDGKESACNAGDLGLTPGLGRSPGEGKGNPLQYSGLENSMDYIDHGVSKTHNWEIILLHTSGFKESSNLFSKVTVQLYISISSSFYQESLSFLWEMICQFLFIIPTFILLNLFLNILLSLTLWWLEFLNSFFLCFFLVY